MRKNYHKKLPDLVGRDCIKCGKPLVYRTHSEKGTRFIGCIAYPHCKYTETIYDDNYYFHRTRIEKITDFFKSEYRWVPNCEYKILEFIDKNCGSGEEVKYFLGAAYYLDKNITKGQKGIELQFTQIQHNNQTIEGVSFFEPFQYWDSPSPSAMAFVPQLEFVDENEKLMHQDFGIFFSSEHGAMNDQWFLGLAIELDIDAMHFFQPYVDQYRDQQVNYPVMRLTKKNSNYLTWFSKIVRFYSDMFEYPY